MNFLLKNILDKPKQALIPIKFRLRSPSVLFLVKIVQVRVTVAFKFQRIVFSLKS